MMRSVTKNILALCSLTTIALTGCTYGPTPYGGYGASPYGGSPYGAPYPGYQQAPIQTLQPGQQYVPNGTVLPQGTYPGSVPTYQNGSGGLTPIPNQNGASSDAPPYSSSEINKPVPAPSNPGGSPFYNNSSSSTTFLPPKELKPIQPATHLDEPIQPITNELRGSAMTTPPSSPTAVYSPQPTEFNAPSAPMNGALDISQPMGEIPSIPPVNTEADPFSTPAPAPSQGAESAPQAMPIFGNTSNIRSYKVVPTEEKLLDHDPQYKWLRGVVSKDEPTKTWSVVYSDNPQPGDTYAGHLSLASSPYLSDLKDGDVVEVKGEIDPVITDPLGKPVFLISHLRTITRAPAQP